MTDNYRQLLQEEITLVNDAVAALNLSYERCKPAMQKVDRSDEDLERLEALTSRFGRLSDILVQKVFRLIDIVEFENEGTVLDRINRAEKRGIIVSAENFKDMRLLRNRIAHEYLKEPLETVFANTFLLTPQLLHCCVTTKDYCKKRYGIH